jgi:hypothetical protein
MTKVTKSAVAGALSATDQDQGRGVWLSNSVWSVVALNLALKRAADRDPAALVIGDGVGAHFGFARLDVAVDGQLRPGDRGDRARR